MSIFSTAFASKDGGLGNKRPTGKTIGSSGCLTRIVVGAQEKHSCDGSVFCWWVWIAFNELNGTSVVVVVWERKIPLSLFLSFWGSFQQALSSGGWKGLLLWQAVGMLKKKEKGGAILFFQMCLIVFFPVRQALVALCSNRVATAAMPSAVLVDSDPSPARVSPSRCFPLSLSLKN